MHWLRIPMWTTPSSQEGKKNSLPREKFNPRRPGMQLLHDHCEDAVPLDGRAGDLMKRSGCTRKPAASDELNERRCSGTATGRILIVDDDQDVRRSIAQVLEEQGYQVMTAANGQEALIAISHMTPPPDMILLDLCMPVMNGTQFVRRLSQVPDISGIPIVLFSGELNLRHHALALEASAYLKKPVDPERLLALAYRFSPIH